MQITENEIIAVSESQKPKLNESTKRKKIFHIQSCKICGEKVLDIEVHNRISKCDLMEIVTAVKNDFKLGPESEKETKFEDLITDLKSLIKEEAKFQHTSFTCRSIRIGQWFLICLIS